ncbi:MAG: DUF2723 domain-containing protein [Anaerolineae bacterium]
MSPRGRWLALGVSAATLIVYLLTLAPGLTFEHAGTDGGDLITAAWTWGVPHPTGYPFYTLLAALFARLPIGPTIAYRVNLLSAVSAAGAAGLVCLIAQRLYPKEPHRLAISAATGLTFGFSALLWSQAVISEVYTLLTFIAALLLWLLLRWQSGGRDANLWLAGLLLGLGLGNHLTIVFFAPAALVLLWPQRRRWFHPTVLLPAAGLFLAGLFIYVYLPLAARHYPPVNWGNPQTWKGFLWVVTAEQYQAFAFGLAPDQYLNRLGSWALLLGEQFGWWGLLISLAGAGWWWRQERRFVLFALTWILPLAAYTFLYDTGDSYVYLLPVFMLLALFWGKGCRYLLYLARGLHRAWQRAVLAGLLLLPLLSLAIHWQESDLSHEWTAHAFLSQTLESVEPDSLIVVRGDRSTFALWYGLYVEERRPDVAVANGPMLAFIWYRDLLRHLYPDLTVQVPVVEGTLRWDDLVRELVVTNIDHRPIYATDPKESWEEWFTFVETEAPIYRVEPKAGQEPPE